MPAGEDADVVAPADLGDEPLWTRVSRQLGAYLVLAGIVVFGLFFEVRLRGEADTIAEAIGVPFPLSIGPGTVAASLVVAGLALFLLPIVLAPYISYE